MEVVLLGGRECATLMGSFTTTGQPERDEEMCIDGVRYRIVGVRTIRTQAHLSRETYAVEIRRAS